MSEAHAGHPLHQRPWNIKAIKTLSAILCTCSEIEYREMVYATNTLLLRRAASPLQTALLQASLPKSEQMNRHTKQNGRLYCCVILIVYMQLKMWPRVTDP